MNMQSLIPSGSMLVIALLVFIGMTVLGLRKEGQAVYQFKRLSRFVAEAPVRLVLRPFLLLLARVPLLGRLSAWFWSKATDSAIAGFFDARFASSKDPLRRGDIEQVATNRWPKERFPHLWMQAPADLVRPLVVDGRLPDGSRPADLAPRFIDDALVGQAFRQAVFAGLFWLAAGLLLWHPQSLFGRRVIPAAEQLHTAMQEDAQARSGLGLAGEKQEPVFAGDLSAVKEDVWDSAELQAKVKAAGELQAKVGENRRESILSSAPSGMITAILFGFLVWFGTWRGLIRSAVQSKIEPLLRPTKESIVRWKYRGEQRALEYQAHIGQLKTLETFDKSPTIELGKASGVLAYRGHLNAPQRGQSMQMSLNDMAQHLLVLGGTGEGKTRSVLRPIVDQLLALRAQETNKAAISFYCTDGKGVLWQDIKAAAEKAGQGDDVRVIGCRHDAGEYGVDLLNGVEPQQVADTIRSVARQVGGGASSDDFWPNMAANVIRVCATVARAWEVSPDGESLLRQTNERIYSLVRIYQLALDQKMQDRAIRAIDDALQSDDPLVSQFATPELSYAIGYLRTTWREMAPATQTGIIANITQVMSPFATNLELRNSFASGSGKHKQMSISDAWGSICLVNVPSLEYGLAGRVVNVFLKTLLYTQARRREIAEPSIGQREKIFFVADEFQDLITADVAGISDATFWNVARSTGTVGIISTQGMASLEQAVGKVAADNFALQMRSKIILRVEDLSTINFAKALAGKTLRAYTFESGQNESYEAMVRELGRDPLLGSPARINELPDDAIKTLASGWFQVPYASMAVNFDTWRNNIEVDTRFIPRHSAGGMGPQAHDNSSEVRSAEQAAHWRAEDKNLSLMSEGNHDADVIREEDLIGMGRAHAFFYLQRAGGARVDLARVG